MVKAMNNLKAYKVTDEDHEVCAVVFAETANRAKYACVGHSWFDWYEYIDLRATRLKDVDDQAEKFGFGMIGDRSDVDNNTEAYRVMRSLGWYELEGNLDECGICGLYAWEDLPESQLVEVTEDGIDDYICKGCMSVENNQK